MASVVQSHLTLLLSQGKVFDRLFVFRWLKEFRQCSLCLGFWTAIIVSVIFGCFDFRFILFTAGLGHIFFLLRERYLPCDKCKVTESRLFKFVKADDGFEPDKKSKPHLGE